MLLKLSYSSLTFLFLILLPKITATWRPSAQSGTKIIMSAETYLLLQRETVSGTTRAHTHEAAMHWSLLVPRFNP
jgi:hypothetical protein